MRDTPLYVESADADEQLFYGEGVPPAMLESRDCKCVTVEDGRRRHGVMYPEISAVTIGDPPISSWSWVCRSCQRTIFGGRWRSDE